MGHFLARFKISRRTIGSDLVAGLTLGVESVPDAMASAVLAGVNPIYGLHAVMLSTPVGALFTSSVFMSVQTTSALSLIISQTPAVSGENTAQALFTLAILTGIFMLLAGLLKLGSLLRFVPNSVMTGFINGVAVLIILGQLGDLTGYYSSAPNKVLQAVDLGFNMNQVVIQSLMVGLVTILMIVLLSETRVRKMGMVIAIIVASLLVPLFNWDAVALVEDISEIPGSLPRPVLPNLSLIPALILPAISIAIVGLVQGAGVSQNYANPNGKYPDASGDFIGQGAANVATGIFQGMPVGGSLSATSLVVSSGARSRWSNIFAGVVIAATLVLLGSFVGKLAMPALAGLLIVVGFQTLRPDEVETVWKTGNVQRVVMTITFIGTLLVPLQYAVLLGVGLSILLFVFDQSNKVRLYEWVLDDGGLPLEQPAPDELPSDNAIILVPYGSLFYAAAHTFEEALPSIEDTHNAVVILHLRGRSEVGSTLLAILERYAERLKDNGSKLMLAEVSRNVRHQLVHTGQIQTIGWENIYMATERFGESLLDAYGDAKRWIKENSGDSK
jgi:SulP family sulfate permease